MRKNLDSTSSSLHKLRHVLACTYTCPKCHDSFSKFEVGNLITINSDMNKKESDLREMIDSYLQNMDSNRTCRKSRCKGKCTSHTRFVPGTDTFIININRVSSNDDDITANSNEKYSRLQSTVNIPFSFMVISGNPYSLILDDEVLDVKTNDEMMNEIKERNRFVLALIYKQELERWDCSSSSEEEQSL